jgi:hypothetical protein
VIVARKIFASYKIDEHSVKIDDDVSDVDVLDGLCSGRLREVVLDRGVLRTTGFYNYLGTIGMTVPPDEGVETENAETRGDGEDEVSGEDLVDAVAGYKVPSVDNDGKQVPAVVPISKGGVIEFVPVASTPVADAIRDYARGNLSDFPEDLATIGHQDLGEILIGNYGFMLDLWTDLAAKNKQLKSLQTRMNALGDGNAAAGLSNAAIARQLSDSNAEVERLKGELESAKRQMPNAGARADDIDITQLREQLVAANRGVSELDGQLAQRDTVIIQLRADLASEKNAKDSKQTELVSKVQEVRDLETRLAEARDSLDDFRRTLEAAEEENRVSKSKELTLTDEVERLVRYCNDLQSGTIPDDRISIMDEGALIDLRDKTQAALKALQMKKGDETLKTTLKAPRRVAGGTDRGAAKQTMTPEQRVTTPPEHQQPPETGRAGAPGTQRPEVGPLKAPRRVAKR